MMTLHGERSSAERAALRAIGDRIARLHRTGEPVTPLARRLARDLASERIGQEFFVHQELFAEILRALEGELDGCRAIRDRLLPGWGVRLDEPPVGYARGEGFGRCRCEVEPPHGEAGREKAGAFAERPAHAWLAAMCVAIGARERSDG